MKSMSQNTSLDQRQRRFRNLGIGLMLLGWLLVFADSDFLLSDPPIIGYFGLLIFVCGLVAIIYWFVLKRKHRKDTSDPTP
jgi:hypothetical protein